MRGKLIVIDGTDASGKHTQSLLLLKFLKKKHVPAELISFPRYNTFFGKLIKNYLNGKFGNPHSLPAEFCALLYALDRYQIKNEIEKKLAAGKTIICDRYVQANIAYQTAKFHSKKEQKKFLQWISAVESRMPTPTKIIFLDMPIKLSQKLMKGRRQKDKKDKHESDLAYLQRTRKIFQQLAKKQRWIWIKAYEKRYGKLIPKTRKAVHAEILSNLDF